jgi:hypothetical protein
VPGNYKITANAAKCEEDGGCLHSYHW